MFGEEILLEIDSTLDQLIQNAEAIQDVNLSELSETEVEAFQKTQESLIHHLIHMDQFLETKRKSFRSQDKRSASYKIQEKLLKFETLKSKYSRNLSGRVNITPIFSKRRNKKFLAVH